MIRYSSALILTLLTIAFPLPRIASAQAPHPPPSGAASNKAKPLPKNAPASDKKASLYIYRDNTGTLHLTNKAPASEQKYSPCDSGPQALRHIDAREHEGRSIEIYDHLGRPVSVEVLAEMYISGCSEALAEMAMLAGMVSDSPLQSIVSEWQVNLDFMKWWLQNRRTK